MASRRDTLTDDLTAEEREILDYMLQNEQSSRSAAAQILPCDHTEDTVLSFGQQRLWLLHELSKNQPVAYDTLTIKLRVQGKLHVEALRQSLAEIVDRHEVLRTTFVLKDDDPVQVVGEADPVFEQIDLSELPREQRKEDLARLLQQAGNTLFDLAQGPLFKTCLIRLDDSDHVLIMSMHHIVFDVWSNGILMRELTLLYESFDQGKSSPLTPLPIQYRDFAAWQRNWLQGEVLQKHLAYWTGQLADISVLELPTDYPRPPIQTFNGAFESLLLPQGLSQALQTFSKQRGVTLYMTMLSVLGVLLGRHSGQDDIAIGTPIANRDREEIQNLIGFFLNMLVMRLDLSGEPSFDELLERVKQTALAGYAHQHLPFERLVEEMQLGRDTNRTPLFQVTFTLIDSPEAEPIRIRDLELSPVSNADQTSRFDLEFYVKLDHDDLALMIAYNTDLFAAGSIRRMLEHFQELLQGVANDASMRVNRLPMMTRQEFDRIVNQWNQTATDYPYKKTVTELFEQRVLENPEAIAIEYGGHTHSYAELNKRSNQLAHYLQARGVGPDIMVGICLERSLEMVVGLLGILKAGGAYVPLDPDYPQPRLAFMLEDARVPVLLSRSTLAERIPDFDGELVCLDTDWIRIDEESGANLTSATTADNLAYVIYTSGSTGTPKGVEIQHRAINRLVCNTDYYQVDTTDRIAQASTVSFDAATFEIWGALLNGARLVGISKEVLLDSKSLVAFLQERSISAMFLTTALFNQIAAEAPDAFAGLRSLMFGGEAVDPGAVRQVLSSGPPERLLHVYGPTESTTFASWHQIENVPAGATTVPIGRPLANTTLYVLDQGMNPVPVGVPGELYIGGDGLARGYLDQPELTAERFVANPFSEEPGGRLYRTGDKVRYSDDGAIVFVGRFDHQVKVRGYRIELGEIENVLAQHVAVQQAIVMLHEDEPGEKCLVAYILVEKGASPTAEILRQHVRASLPEYMVPALFELLNEFPLTLNGKVDRDALPAPDFESLVEESYVAPSGDLEARIAKLWCDLLGLEKVGTRDNFFDLGGHSLLLGKLHARLKNELDTDIAIVELFRYTTVESLARHLGGTEFLPPVGEEIIQRIQKRRTQGLDEEAIAVIGMAGQFPGAPDIETFWQNLTAGVESIRFFSDEELSAAGIPEYMYKNPAFVPARGYLDDAYMFDAAFFGYSPSEAELIDPQQRLFLETSWLALENAACDPRTYPGLISVYAGVSLNTYLESLYSRPDLMAKAGVQIGISNEKDFLATRVSYKLDLKGPSFTVQTACSTSLVAIHEACRCLSDFGCDMALAGGVSVMTPRVNGYTYVQGSIYSRDGHTRSFDADASGFVGGEGAGVVVLKRLKDAIADRDIIHAVVKGSAVNNDGAGKVGFTAPSIIGQANVIAMAHAVASVPAETISYIETHGTGTNLGDPIEVSALTQAFTEHSSGHHHNNQYCALGALKTNIGHLDAAAGVAGFIKTVLSLEHAQIPPSLNFTSPNPEIDFEHSPFYVNTELVPWEVDGDHPRRAGVSSFGMGGTNAHAVLEEAPPRDESEPGREWQFLPVSAKNEDALAAYADRIADYLERNSGSNLADVSYTLRTGRGQFEYRCAAVGNDIETGAADLRLEKGAWTTCDVTRSPPVIFMFPGQGSQHLRMAQGLYESEDLFREVVEDCCEQLQPEIGVDLRELMFAEAADAAQSEERLRQTLVAQCALFVIEYALARLWMSWGIRPAAMIGHSIGEYVAACISGVIELPAALSLIASRGQAMAQAPAGAMMAVPLSEEAVIPYLQEDSWLSVINGHSSCVVSGTPEAIGDLEQRMRAEGVETTKLHTSGAFHSGLMDEVVPRLVEVAGRLDIGAVEIPYISNVTGNWIEESQLEKAEYWGQHLRDTVRFADGIEVLLEKYEDGIFLEVGPGNNLSSMVRQSVSVKQGAAEIVASLRHPREDLADGETVTRALARLWRQGVEIDWPSYDRHGRRCKLELPTYPFQRQRYWVEPSTEAAMGTAPITRQPLDKWFYVPSWKRLMPLKPRTQPEADGCWLLLCDETETSSQVSEWLRTRGFETVNVFEGNEFRQHENGDYSLDPSNVDDYRLLAESLEQADRFPDHVIHLWSITPVAEDEKQSLDTDDLLLRCYHSLVYLMQVLGGSGSLDSVDINVISNAAHSVLPSDSPCPEKATLLGPCNVIGLEFPNISCKNVDIEISPQEMDVGILMAEILSPADYQVVAYRNGQRWAKSYEPAPLGAPVPEELPVRQGGVYLITGGLGGIGLTLADFLAREYQAKLVLTARSELPDRERWPELMALENGDADPVVERIKAVMALEQQGAQVLVLKADASDRNRMRDVLKMARQEFGEINGVIHSAGVPGGRVILLQSRDIAEAVMAPKIEGTRILGDLFAPQRLDFMVLCSSLASVLGVAGQVDYFSANAYEDAYAEYYSRLTETPVISINWDTWNESGMAVNSLLAGGKDKSHLKGLGFNNNEGLEVFKRILAGATVSQMAVSTYELSIRMPRRVADVHAITDESQESSGADAPTVTAKNYERPRLKTAYLEPSTEVEKTICELWEQLLAIDNVGINDNFFELGGHSLLAINAVNSINASFGSNLSVARFMTLATVSKLADEIQTIEPSGDTDAKPLLKRLDPDSEGETYPLSFAQERLWYIHALYPDIRSAYNIHFYFKLDAPVNRLAEILRRLQQQHAILRTTFMLDETQPVQRISQSQEVPIHVIDVADFTTAEDIEQQIILDGREPFNLETGPVWRCNIVKQGERALGLSVAMHHITTDGLSIKLLKQEILRLCRQDDIEAELDRLKPGIQYIDYALWHREHLDATRLEGLQAYWAQQLSGIPDTIDLPTDKPRPPVYSHAGAFEFVALSAAQSHDLRGFAREHEVTLYMLMLAVFKLLLARYTQQSDIVVGTPASGRTLPEMDDIIGLFLNSLVLRSDLSASQTFTALLERVKETTLEAFEHQDFPFEKVVEIVQPERDLSRNPVFQVMFNLLVPGSLEQDDSRQEPADMSDEMVSSDAAGALVDLTLIVKDDQKQLVIGFEYYTDLFETSTIRRMLMHYQNLLQRIVENPGARLSEIELLAADERQQLLVEWNATKRDYPLDRSVSALFEDRVSSAEDASAVIYGEQTLGYGELNRRSNQLAHYLQGQGVGPGVIVGICVEPSLEMVVGLLAILKAGGAYLPLDPGYPLERLSFMLQDSGAEILLGGAELPAGLATADTRVVSMTDDAAAIAAEPEENLESEVVGDDLAYVIYTSGSTGRPKGVMGLQRGIVNRLSWMWEAYPYEPGERCCQKTTLSFVDAVAEIFSPLLSGLSLVVVDEATAKDAQALARLVSQQGVTRLVVVPSLLRAFLELDDETISGLECVRHWVTSGERLEPELESRLRARFPQAKLLNLYGSSEVSADVTCFDTAQRGERGGSLIGRPIANTRAYALDRWLNPVPVGVPGELHIGGAGLARGYMNQPELTAERFIADPFGASGEQLYKMGDLVRYGPDGILEYLGRVDQQVKVRGFRIELGEIEAVLAEFAGIDQVVAVIREDIPGNPQLVAYVTGPDQEAFDDEVLKDYLLAHLPQYMLPSSMVLLDEWPLLANGKIDRKGLPDPVEYSSGKDQQIVEPRTETERQIADILQSLLNLKAVGVTDNFFRLGGHSLLAIRAVNQINKALDSGLSNARFMTLATVEKLAREIQSSDISTQGDVKSLRAQVDLTVEDAGYPLSFAQERLWYIHALYPEIRSAYNIQFYIPLDAPVNRLQAILERLQQQHAILRTRFTLDGEQPIQKVSPSREAPLVVIDVTDFASEEAIEQQIIDNAKIPFDLEKGPIWRCTIVKQGERALGLSMVVHHIATDGWSMNLLKQQILELCRQDVTVSELGRIEPGIQYIDYSLWQRERLDAKRLESLQAYWSQKLGGIPDTIVLPVDKPRPPVFTHSGAFEYASLSAGQSDALRGFAREHEVTLYMLMLAAFQLLLARYTQQSDIVVGTPVSGRTESEMTDIVGLFVNSLVLRSDLSASQSFAALLAQVRETTLEAFEHQDLPFEKIVEIVQPERDLSRNPVFQVMFNFLVPEHREQDNGREPEALSEEIVSSGAAGALVDLTLFVKDDGQQLLVGFEYYTDLFEADSIRQMLVHYRNLLGRIVENPGHRLSEIELLGADERQQLLVDWNATERDYPLDRSVSALFEDRVLSAEDAPAVVYEEQTFSYGELNRRANQLAHYLQSQGVGPGSIVGICIERNQEMIVGLLATLKAGGAYLPLDPGYPLERLSFMLQDSGAEILLSGSGLPAGLATTDTRVVSMAQDAAAIAAEPDENLASAAGADDLAYVIYTSGSTGRPKGVQISHHALANFLQAMAHEPGLDQTDTLLAVTTLSFDIAGLELYLPLVQGARLVLASRAQAADGEALTELLAQQGVTVMQATPATWRILLETGWSGSSTLKILCGGEALPRDLAAALLPRCGELWNLYGPTETTIWSTRFRVQEAGAPVLIGRPIENTRIYILDEQLSPVPVGVYGDLYIGGEGLARGYLDRPELTAERFIDDPFTDARMYRSGDLARYRPDGNIEYLGRSDHQVKLRGFRIELGEIESVLGGHAEISAAVAVIREDNPGNPQLVAYVTGPDEVAFDEALLKDYLLEHLPQYMVPSSIVMLNEWPLLANGKIDRNGLPDPAEHGGAAGEQAIAPRNETERRIAEVWQSLLNVKAVGVSDNFFRLGGHSLLAIRAVNQINEALESGLSNSRFMTLATVEKLAAEIESGEGAAQVPLLAQVDISAAGVRYPLSFAQERLWYIHALYPDIRSTYNIPLYVALDAPVGRVKAVLEHMQRQHAILRTTYALDGAQPVQQVDQTSDLPLRVLDVDDFSAEQDLEWQIIDNVKIPFDLEAGPVWRGTLVKQGDQALGLSMVVHHIATDGWSLNLLKQEVLELCRQDLSEAELARVEPGIQYIDYALWQREQLDAARLEALQVYWSQRLDGIPDTIDLPTDKPRPPVYSYSGAFELVALSAEQSDALRGFAREHEVTLYMLMLAVFKLLLARYTQQSDIVVGTPVTGRNQAEMADILGLFVNMLVLRSDLTHSKSFEELLAEVRETTLEAFEHQDLPFEKIVEIVQPERDLSRNPVFQVMFNFLVPEHREAGDEREAVDLSEDMVSSDAAGAQVDLTLYVKDDDQQLVIGFEYYTDLFEAESIRRMLTHYRNLLGSILAQPSSSLSEIELLAADERQQLLVEWNATKRDYPLDRSVSALFEDRVSSAEDAPAVIDGEQTLSYGELNRQANRLAHYLQGQGVGSGVIVGICVEPSLEMVVGLLAILKAGGAYLPLDPGYPLERLSFMLQDSGAEILLGGAELPAGLATADTRVVSMTDDAAAIAAEPEENLESVVGGDDLAYVIYTSGSTGRPKGVMGLQRGIVNRLSWMWEAYPYEPGERCCQKTTLSFVDAVAEIFSPLLSGLSLVVVDEATAKDAQALARLVSQQGVTRLVVVPSLLRAFLELDDETISGLECVRHWVTSGERLEPELEQRLRARFPQAKLLNLYGSSEVSADVTCFDTAQRGERGGSLIGRPIANTRAYALDRWLNPVPVGVPGELHIGGAGLARGYMNQPELTAERFIADPFGASGEQLYKMGDLVRYGPDGILEYLGRVDQQVKLRGFRIELGEIEAVLAEFAGIDQVVAVIREDIPGNPQLVAYVTGPDQEAFDDEVLKDYLLAHLPQYMLPSSMVLLDEWPLLANGKIDRKGLPDPVEYSSGKDQQIVEPRTETERQIADILQSLLNLKAVGVTDNFFRLGGHSLLAIRVVNEINQRLDSNLSNARFMTLATVEKLAAEIELDEGATLVPLLAQVDISAEGVSFPLSFAQERLWYIHDLYPDIRSAYNIPLYIPLDTPVDRLQAILASLQQRHAVLRTSYTLNDAQPIQKVSPSREAPLVVIDVTDFASEEAIEQQIIDNAKIPFDLEKGPIWRCTIVKQGERALGLSMVVHHIATDGWSMNLLKQQILELCRQDDVELAPPGIQYIDYALWQREQLDVDRLEGLQAYWSQKLNGIPDTIDLPTDKARPPVYSYSGAFEFVALSAGQSDALRGFAREHEVTLYMLMLAAFKLLLARYTQQSDIVVGTPVSGRTQSEMTDIVGLFVNSLVLRSDLSAPQSFAALLAQVRETTLEAFEHQDLPFEKIVEIVQPERDLSRNPVFQVMFNFLVPEHREQDNGREPEALSEEIVSSDAAGSLVDLTLFVKDDGNQLLIGFEYYTDLFEADSIRRMLTHYRNLLGSILAQPSSSLSELELLGADERQQLLVDWNATERDYPLDRTLSALFEDRVSVDADAPAVIYGEQTQSYGELNRRSNRLAHYLRGQGVEPGVIVGICIERSQEMIVGLLATLKAGGAYLPLDPGYPLERLSFMLQDSGAEILLSGSGLPAGLATTDTRVVSMAQDAAAIAAEPDENLASAAGADDLAYVIYTSGSTGRPKGVQISHHALANFLQAMAHEPGLDQTDTLLAVTTLSFDIAGLELYLPLVQGARLVLASRAQAADGEALTELLAQQGVTVMQATPATWRILLETGWSGSSTLKILCGGEALPRDLAAALLPRCGELWNLYGPTETTIWSTRFRVQEAGAPVLIGRPIENTRIYILDEQLSPVPVGVYGDLYIGGEGLARGYLDRPELTAERFIDDPFTDARMYRSGDLARYRPDGNIEYLGRSDHQVKLRGFRIELGEIESVLGGHAEISAAVAVIREDNPGNPQLVAYVTGPDEVAFDEALLKDYLLEHLPQYMVPSSIVMLNEWPLLANGKIDRNGLPDPAEHGGAAGEQAIAPRNETERRIAEVWQSLLNVKAVGVSDNFFRLGGHSLLAIRAVNQINEALESGLSNSRFMTLATVEKLAAEIESGEGAAQVPLLAQVDISAAGVRYPLSFAQERLWYIHALYPDIRSTYNIPLYVALDAPVGRVKAVLEHMQRQHAILRTTYALDGAQPVQQVDQTSDLPLRVLDVDDFSAEQDLERQIIDNVKIPFDLEAGPVWRGTLVKQGDQALGLSMVVHHIATDGWSLNLLKQEVLELCRQDLSEAELARVEPGIQYIDYALWQREQLDAARLEALQVYWSQRLDGIPDTIDLPTDKPRPPVYSYSGAFELVALSAEQSDALRGFAREHEVTLYMLMLAVFKLLLARYTQQSDIVVGTPVTGRNQAEMADILGLFVNMLVLRSDLTHSKSFEELLAEVRETTLEAFEHQDLPFEKIVEIVQPERDLSRNPVFQVMFNFLVPEHREAGDEREAVDLSEDMVSSDAAGAQVDLTLYVKDDDQQLVIGFEYYTDLFEAESIRRMLTHYRNLLGSILAQPSSSLSEIELLAADERQQLLVEWNATKRDYPLDRSVSALFEDRVSSAEDAPAVIDGEQTLSYGELNRQANRLAHYLQGQGVGSGVIVGICVEPSLEMVVGLLAILKAGGAYLPLDPGYPLERLSFMLQDSGAEILLGGAELPAGLATADTRVVSMTDDAAAIAAEPEENLESVVGGDDLAYVIYTSGSTGRPKGVMGLQRGIVNRLSWMWEAYPYEPGERCCQKTTLSFVDAVAEIFSPLLSGLSLVVVDEATAKDAQALARLVSQQGVTRLVVVPSLLRAFLELDDETISGLECVRHWVTSGERLEPELESRLRARFPQAKLLNLYGSSEVSADVTCFDTAQRGERGGSLIGRPIANTRAYALDRWLNPAPVGVPGELHIGGAGLARGYMNQPELTAERFIADPFGASGEQLYKMGDLVRYGPDGIMEYLGRVDQQVKVRGFRIELAEVETALANHDQVREAVVVADGGERLVAYIVTDEDAALEPATLREHLVQTLPIYMLPSVYVALDEFPLTTSGKVDRKRLPRPSQTLKRTRTSSNKPESKMEIIMAEIWEELLEIDDIETDDMFFDLGGHSLLALTMINRFAEETNIRIPPANSINQTLRQLAAYAEASTNSSDEDSGESSPGATKKVL